MVRILINRTELKLSDYLFCSCINCIFIITVCLFITSLVINYFKFKMVMIVIMVIESGFYFGIWCNILCCVEDIKCICDEESAETAPFNV